MFKLKKIQSTHSNLRTEEVLGTCLELPKEGERFKFFSAPLEQGSVRVINTSPVKSFASKDGSIIFNTQNSTYELSSIEGEEFI